MRAFRHTQTNISAIYDPAVPTLLGRSVGRHLITSLCIAIFTCLLVGSSAQTNLRVDPFFNGTFPPTTPGANGAWDVEDFVPDLQIGSPLRVLDVPNENSVFVLGKMGQVWKINLDDKSQQLVLDIRERCMVKGEGGTVGMTIHPTFNDEDGQQTLFLYYRYAADPIPTFNKGYNRLSKFTWDENVNMFPEDSEEVLIQQYDSHIWHNGGALFFDNEGYLYVTVGDEGASDMVDITQSTQRIERGFFSGILRIDVDNDMTRSHPIRRQPEQIVAPPDGWEPTLSQGYSIPNDNPWLSPNGELLEEFYAIGLRAPYSAFYDPREDDIWISDVGSVKLEEINLITKGSNYQWPYAEGDLLSDDYEKPDPLLGIEQAPYYFYNRNVGSAVVGGGIYRGLDFPSLDEKFIFGDYVRKSVMVIDKDTEGDPTILIGNLSQSMSNNNIDIPETPGVAGVSILKDGTVLISIISGKDFEAPGKLLKLINKDVVADPPVRLSELNVFKDLSTRTVADGFIPYELNAPLWSDRALKKRWMAIPNDGVFDETSEKIKFNDRSEWEFPIGSVFIKHFDLPTDLSSNDATIPLETRFFIIGEDGVGYGLTYKWNTEGTDAFLQQSKTVESFEIEDNGSFAYNQLWDYPSRANCMTCHNAEAKFVLGLKTHQLNKEILHPNTNVEINQLTYFNQLGLFDQNLTDPRGYLRSYPLESQAPLEVKIRSYLDANCGFCHRKGGSVGTTLMDLRFEQPSNAQFIIGLPTESVASTNEFIVEAGNHMESELWVRDATRNTNQMPPLASNLVDQPYVDSLAKWIGQLQPKEQMATDITIGPNPTEDFMRIDVGTSWLPDYTVRVIDMKGHQRVLTTFTRNISFLDLSSLAAGTYIVEIEQDDLRFLTKVVIL